MRTLWLSLYVGLTLVCAFPCRAQQPAADEPAAPLMLVYLAKVFATACVRAPEFRGTRFWKSRDIADRHRWREVIVQAFQHDAKA